MPDYDALLSAASQLPLADRLRLINDLAATVPDDHVQELSGEWLEEIERRSAEIDAGAVELEDWETVRQRLFRRATLS